jgi:hypothetical protein
MFCYDAGGTRTQGYHAIPCIAFLLSVFLLDSCRCLQYSKSYLVVALDDYLFPKLYSSNNNDSKTSPLVVSYSHLCSLSIMTRSTQRSFSIC